MNAAQNYLDLLYAKSEQSLNAEQMLSGKMTRHEWQTALQQALMRTMGKWPAPVDPKPQELGREELPDHIRVKLSYVSEEGLVTPAYLLLPKNLQGKAPAVVACTGHGYGVREIVGLLQDYSPRKDEPTYQKDFAVELVRRGFIVLAPEPLGFGELMLEGDENRGSSCYRISCDLLLTGRTMIGARVRQLMSAISVLQSMPEVQADRIGAMGISGGGMMASFLAMSDERVRAVVVSGYACMFRRSIYALYHCVDNFPIDLLRYAENADIMGLVAPRPMLWEAGDKDDIFPVEGVREAEATVRKVYEAFGTPDKFAVDYFEGEHQISGRLAYDFLVNALK